MSLVADALGARRMPSGLKLQAGADGAQVLPSDARGQGFTGGPIPHDARGPLVRDTDRVDRSAFVERGPSHRHGGVGQPHGVELHQARARESRAGRGRGGRAPPWHRAARWRRGHPRCPTSTTRTPPPVVLMPRARSRTVREARACPGLRMPTGSKLFLRPRSTSKPEPRARGEEAGPVEPDAVMVADGGPVGQGGVGHRVPGLAVVVLAPRVVALGPATGEGEVEAGPVGVGVGLVGRSGQRAVDRNSSAATTSSKRAGRAAHGPEISAVSTTMPARHRGARAETSLRCPSQRSTRATSSGSAPAAGVHSSSTTAMVAASRAGSVSSRTMSTLVSGCSKLRAGLGLVVEAEHGGRGSPAEDLAAGLEPGLEGGEAEGPPLLGGRQWMECGNEPR